MKQLLITIVLVLFTAPCLLAQDAAPGTPEKLSLEDELSVQKVQNKKLVAQINLDRINTQIAAMISRSPIGKKRDASGEQYYYSLK